MPTFFAALASRFQKGKIDVDPTLVLEKLLAIRLDLNTDRCVFCLSLFSQFIQFVSFCCLLCVCRRKEVVAEFKSALKTAEQDAPKKAATEQHSKSQRKK